MESSGSSDVHLAYSGDHYMLLIGKSRVRVNEEEHLKVIPTEKHKGAKPFKYFVPEEFHPGISLFKGTLLKMMKDALATKIQIVTLCITTINISSDESLDTKPTMSLNNKKSRKRARPKNEIAEEMALCKIQQEISVEELVYSMSGLSSTDTTHAKKSKGLKTAKSKWSKKLFESGDEDDTFIQKGQRKYINQESIDKLEPVQVSKVPPTPNGNVKYEVTVGTGTVRNRVKEVGSARV
ncbi:Hypothetical predicted protein [Paramuricea clavata]|uniref:Uncharacterized protein n=1 Tax=Paramuricea clavata TaxID=317549 RepID=A0A7D9EW47_PARCT|nr:Hypothetical predicted protein [Paramuricea clavata]